MPKQLTPEVVRHAIKLVRDGLVSGELPFENFSMSDWMVGAYLLNQPVRGCGAVGCIGGWAELALRKAGYEYDLHFFSEEDEALFRLFFKFSGGDLDYNTVEGVANAITRWLAGDPDPWHSRIFARPFTDPLINAV